MWTRGLNPIIECKHRSQSHSPMLLSRKGKKVHDRYIERKQSNERKKSKVKKKEKEKESKRK